MSDPTQEPERDPKNSTENEHSDADSVEDGEPSSDDDDVRPNNVRTDPSVTVQTVTELHRRLLDVDSTVGDLETTLTVITELLAADENTAGEELQGEVTDVVEQIDAANAQLDEIASAARRLKNLVDEQSSDTSGGSDAEPSGREGTSVFDDADEYVRNTAATTPDDQ
ncbi:hypothetical protein [Halobellus inordinatus]|uniref:hypothetical protein n=1 Tax=Halobellus inordinatus TaxID=1126236 RepID=UPI00210EF137|nr:hypothetical protein [Halobellus inordinatus]